MGKDTYLINIYLKIHHKQELSMDDLRYLAEYDPECFEKTCRNVVYNIPEAKHIMEETRDEIKHRESKEVVKEDIDEEDVDNEGKKKVRIEKKFFQQASIEKILDNIKRMEISDFPKVNIDVDRVKSLLGSLYMELLFPHNDKDTFFNTMPEERKSTFDKKA